MIRNKKLDSGQVRVVEWRSSNQRKKYYRYIIELPPFVVYALKLKKGDILDIDTDRDVDNIKFIKLQKKISEDKEEEIIKDKKKQFSLDNIENLYKEN